MLIGTAVAVLPPVKGETLSMPRTPDEDYDVILYECRDTWTVWLGGEKQGERTTLEAALELACHVAAVHSRPAWLLDETGYPLKPIERT